MTANHEPYLNKGIGLIIYQVFPMEKGKIQKEETFKITQLPSQIFVLFNYKQDLDR